MCLFRRLLLLMLFFSVSVFCVIAQDTLKFKFRQTATEKLNHPFGTILTLQVEILDGEVLRDKFHQSSFLFKIKSIDSVALPSPILMDFIDQRIDSSFLPRNDFELYKYFYMIDTGALSDQNIKKIKPKYVGREFTVVGYESGGFIGQPTGASKYQALRSTPFFFFHTFDVIAVLYDEGWRSLRGSLKK